LLADSWPNFKHVVLSFPDKLAGLLYIIGKV